MKVKTKAGNTYHVENTIGTILIESGLVEAVENVRELPAFKQPNFVLKTKWSVGYTNSGDLIINWECQHCKSGGGTMTKVDPQALTFTHCGQVEKCPAHIAREYERMFPKRKKRVPETRSRFTAIPKQFVGPKYEPSDPGDSL